MNRLTIVTLFLLGFFGVAIAAPPSTSQVSVDSERLIRVYALLKNAEQLATGGVVLADEDLSVTARNMQTEGLKKACAASVERVASSLSSGPTARRPEIFAYTKNAMLRLTLNREHQHSDHLNWAHQNRDKLSSAIRECVRNIKDALAKI